MRPRNPESIEPAKGAAHPVQVLSLVNRSDCSAYDCEFVALARGLGVPLVTMDRKLAASFPETVIRLADPAGKA